MGLLAFSLLVLLLGAAPAAAQGVCDGVSPVNNTALKSVVVASGLTGRPLYVTSPPGDPDRLFIVEQDGLIWIKQRGDDPSLLTLYLDITDRVWAGGFDNEAGLLGLAFDRDYANNGFFYVNYFAGSGFFTCTTNCRTVVSRFSVSAADPDAADPASELQLMTFPQPENNHNGGQVFFDPTGYLYVATGDGGGANDQHGTCGNGQILDTVLGKILRIDVAGIDPAGTAPDSGCSTGFTGANYTVPSDNPFADGPGGNCDEVWAYGLRNPWRNAFDATTGDFYSADVGQDCWEEVSYASAASAEGANYGWRQMEGNHCFNPANSTQCDPPNVACGGSPDCHDPSLVDPVVEVSQADPSGPCSITGGFVYRGCRMPGFDGTYFYGDFCAGWVRSFEIAGGTAVNPQDWTAQLDPGGALANGLTSFGLDARGEMYIVDRSGQVSKMLPPFPDLEVSGSGAGDAFLVNRDGNWSWEDLAFSTMHPVEYYQVYRGVPNGTFTCIHSTLGTTWVTGDTTVPAPGELFAYLVTAVSATEETRSGTPPRTLTAPCGPPA